MKRTTINFMIIFSSLVLASCSGFLEEENRSAIDSSDFFATPEEGLSAVNYLYRNGFPSLYDAGSAYMGPIIMYGGYMSGLYDNQYKGQEAFIQRSQSLAIGPVTDNDALLDVWGECYSAISQANTAIKYIPGIAGITEAESNQYLAEARFFRALNYFHLVKLFGGLPVITEPVESLDSLYVERSPEADVYNVIVADLVSALNEGGLADAPMPSNGFRISKGSISALLADVYLNMSGYPLLADQYANAATTARALINNAAYGLIAHEADETAYDILRTSESESEYLYVVEYDAVIADGGWRPTYCFPNEAATWGEFTYNICNLAYWPVPDLRAVYDAQDDIRMQEKQYFHSKYTFRRGSREGQEIDMGVVAPYFWFEEDALFVTNNSAKDQCHYRLAEMYLIAAEAIARSEGVTAEAAGYLATIKARASMSRTQAEIAGELSTLSVDEFVQEVWREKIRELIFENKIWNDITRTRMYPSVSDGSFTFVDFVGATNPWGRTFAAKNLLLPIPNDEMQRNPLLEQNPEY